MCSGCEAVFASQFTNAGSKHIPLQHKDELLTSVLDFFLVCHFCGIYRLLSGIGVDSKKYLILRCFSNQDGLWTREYK